MYQIIQYIKFLLASTNQHGVHSPFVYLLITECFYNKKTQQSYKALHKYREALYSTKKTITVSDFGAGSRVFKSNKREVSKIAKTAGITTKRAQLLNRLVPYLEIKNSLELGTSLGLATAALSTNNPHTKITTIEGCPETAAVAQAQFNTFKLNNIQLIVDHFTEALPKVTSEKFDLIYMDGNHQKEATLNYFETLLPTTHNNSLIIFDDIHWSEAMTEAWEVIKQHPKVTVTIDTFYWGFVFFRKEQVKEHFTIRL